MNTSNCTVCDSTNSQTLTCGHELCTDCLKKMSDNGQPCPLCRSPLNQCPVLKCDKCEKIKPVATCSICDSFLCTECWSEVHAFEPLTKHKKLTKSNKCPNHDHSDLNLVCIDSTCTVADKLGCVICFHAGTHKSHKSILLSEMTNRERQGISTKIQQLRDKQTTLKEELIQSRLVLKQLEETVVKDDLDLFESVKLPVSIKVTRTISTIDKVFLFTMTTLMSFLFSVIVIGSSVNYVLTPKYLHSHPIIDAVIASLLCVVLPVTSGFLSIKYENIFAPHF